MKRVIILWTLNQKNSQNFIRRSHILKYRIPKTNKDSFKFSFFPKSVCEWNSIPSDIANLSQSLVLKQVQQIILDRL